jgi:hypothetical protein
MGLKIEIGSPGLMGPTGPGGGATGPQGLPGPQGSTGSQGSQGSPGSIGPQGYQGDAGTEGPTGPQGSRGITGNEGIQGSAGATGPTGSLGVTGPTGSLLVSDGTAYVPTTNLKWDEALDRLGVGVQLPEARLDIGQGELQLEAVSNPSTPGTDCIKLYATASGESPNRVLSLVAKFSDGVEIVFASRIF